MCARKNSAGSGSSSATDAATRYGQVSRSNQGGRASFKACPSPRLAAALDGCTSAGDLVGFSRTSDGGAICIYVKADGLDFKSYAVTQEELDDALQILADANA